MDSPTTAVEISPRARLWLHLVAVGFALLGGLLGILGAVVAELRSGGAFLAVFLGAPIAEELTKPVGVYLFMFRWRDVLRSQLYIASLTALSGLCFGVLESLVYVTLYVPDHSQAFFIYRFTVTVLLHATASFIAGLGINTRLVDWANGDATFPRRSGYAFGAAIALHAIYNTTVVILSLTGVMEFD
jgi:RsiW-degrading membrane proteinase PrsW (M82 family)